MSISKGSSRGFTLVEFLIAAMLALIVTAAIIAIYVSNLRSSTATIRSNNLNQELRVVMGTILSDVRRAGYWGNAANAACSTATANPFTVRSNPDSDATVDVRVSKFGAAPDDSCITYSYDRNGAVDPACTDPATSCCVDDFEQASESFGFRLNSTTGAVQIRTGGTSAGNFGCDDGTWEPLTDPNMVTIDTLTFRVLGQAGQPSSQCFNTRSGATWQSLCIDAGATGYVAPASGDLLVETRLVEITLQGHLTRDAEVRAQLREYAKVRNDRVIRIP